VRVRLDDRAHDVVDRVEVAPRLGRRLVGGLDHVQVDAVGEEVVAAQQHDHPRIAPRAGVEVRLEEPPGLVGAHRAVVEVEAEIADPSALAVGDLAVGARRRVQRRRDLRYVEHETGLRERERGRELEALLELPDPDRAVDGRAADRAMALGDDRARRPDQRLLAVHVEEMELGAVDRVAHARMPLGGADLAYHGVRRVRAPVDRAHVLFHRRARAAGDARIAVVECIRRRAGHDLLDRLHEGVDRRAANLVAIEAALADVADRERARGPDVTAVDLAVGLEDRHAPGVERELDRPVERRRSAIAGRSRMHDQAPVARPDRLRDDLLEHRADDQLRSLPRDGRLHRRRRVDDLDGDVVAELGERDIRALAQAVVSRDEEEDARADRG